MKAPTWIVTLSATLALLGSVGSLSAQTASNQKIQKAETGRRIEDLQRAIRSPQAARERFESMRKAQKQIEAAPKDGQNPARPIAPTVAHQGAPAGR